MKKILIVYLIAVVSYLAGNYSNRLVMTANNGKMPVLEIANDQIVLPDKSSPMDNKHELMYKGSKYKLLGDVFYIGEYIFSIGDFGYFLSIVCMFLGCLFMLERIIQQ